LPPISGGYRTPALLAVLLDFAGVGFAVDSVVGDGVHGYVGGGVIEDDADRLAGGVIALDRALADDRRYSMASSCAGRCSPARRRPWPGCR
jgi:hypothetical protein